MDLRVICNILEKHGNCYVKQYPSNNRISKIKRLMNSNIDIRPCSDQDGYIIELVKEVNYDVGNESR